MDIHIREHLLAGVGRRYDIELGDGQVLSVVVSHDGTRKLTVRDRGADEPHLHISLTAAQASAVSALLSGARFFIETDAATGIGFAETGPVGTGSAGFGTLTLTTASPAVGRRAGDVALLEGSDAVIVALIRDDTPQLLEDDLDQPFRPGDRLVVAARPERLNDVIAHLAG